MDTSRTQKPERARRTPSPVQPAERPGAATGPALPPGLDPQALLGLQQAFGNQAVQRLLARAAARPPARAQRGPPAALLPARGPAGQAPPALMREEQEEPAEPADERPEYEAEGSSFFEGADDEAAWRRQEEAARRQEAEDQAFLQGFEVQARLNVINLLLGSEALVQVERQRYGIPLPAVTADTMAAPRPEQQVAAGGENEGLAAAAAELAVATRRVQALYPVAPDAQPQYDMEGAAYFDGTEHGDGPPEGAPDAGEQAPPDPEALNAAIAQAEQDYAVLRTETVAAYPILAMYAPATLGERGRPGLDALAKGPSPEATALLAVDVAERLRNIKTTRTAIAAGTLDVWSLPRIVAITQTQLAASTRQAELIQRRVADAEWDELLGSIALSVLGLALGLAAIGTGMAGAPLAAAAFGALAGGVNAVLTYEHFQDYMIESAAASSDFEKARAIAAGEPSFFWLALDVVATLLDIKVAQLVFRRLLPLAAAAVGAVPEARSAAGRLGEVVSDTADEIPELRALREAGDDEMPGLGDTVVQSAIRADERGAARLAGDVPPGGAAAGDWGARGARLSLPGGSKGPARAVGDYWPEGAADPVRYSATSGRKGTPPPKSALTQPERHVLKPPEPADATRGFEPGEQYRGVPKGLTAEEREAWLRANKAEGHHPGSRAHDAEAKMFEDLLNDTSARSAGEFHFKVTHPVCPSCKEMIFRFRQMRPGIQVIQHSP